MKVQWQVTTNEALPLVPATVPELWVFEADRVERQGQAVGLIIVAAMREGHDLAEERFSPWSRRWQTYLTGLKENRLLYHPGLLALTRPDPECLCDAVTPQIGKQ